MIKNLLGLFLVFLPLILVSQQTELRPVTTTTAITNAIVITKPGMQIENATVILKDGLIHSVGQQLKLPPDAQVIKGDSMYIYAGFIDGLSHTGIASKEESEERPKVKPGKVPNDMAGITPEQQVKDVYNQKEGSISSMRELGFTLAHIVPKGRMLPGKGSIVSLNGKPSQQAVVKEDVSLFSQFKPAQGMFPATTIGVIAKWKDLYNQAKDGSKYESSYALAQGGLKRPDYKPAVRGMYSVVDKSTPVYFTTEKRYDIYRAMSLSKELGFDIVLANVKQGWDNLDHMKQAKGVILSAYLPKETKEEKKDSTKKVDPEVEALTLKSKASKAAYESQASVFEKENIPFSFTTIGVKSKDIYGNIRRMIKNGLSEKMALAALTTEPARLLQIGNMAGTIEKGKLANLIISTKPIFDEKMKIKYVFVDGEKYEYNTKKKKKKSGKSEDIAGSWKYDIEIPGMAIEGTMEITKAGDDTYDIVMKNTSGLPATFKIDGQELEGGNAAFDTTVDANGDTMTVTFDLDFEEDEVEGTITVPEFGTFPITGSKKSPKQ